MSSPDNINVEISTSSSSGNLRQLAAAAAAAAAAVSSSTTAAAGTTTGDGINNVAPASSSSSTMTAQHQQNHPNQSGSGHAAGLNNNFSNSSSNEDDYAAWMIGSTEGLARARVAAAAAAAAVPPAAGSLPNQLWQINLNSYNNSNNNDNNNQRPLSVASPTPTESTATTTPSLSAGSSPLPPSSSPPTLGGLSQQHHMTHGANMHPPLPHPPPYASSSTSNHPAAATSSVSITNRYHSTILTTPTPHVESLLSTICETLNFDIAEMWLRTGPKTHQLTHSHVRPTALDEDIRQQLVDVYYGERSAERTHRLSPALCKRAKEAGEVVWVTAQTRHGAEALKCSISDVRTAVAVPVCHTTNDGSDGSGVNVTIIYFSIRRAIMKPQAVEFLVHMSLAVAVASVNSLAEEIHVVDSEQPALNELMMGSGGGMGMVGAGGVVGGSSSSGGVVVDPRQGGSKLSKSCSPMPSHHHHTMMPNRSLAYPQGSDPRTATPQRLISVTGAQLNLQWESLRNVEYLTDGGNNWIHTAVLQGKSVVVKTLKPECQDVALAINEIEGELEIHSRLDHPNIVKLIGAGFTPRGVRFVVLERLDGGTLTQLLGYDTRIRDRRRRFWTKKKISYMDVLKCARSLAEALAYCHGRAIPNAMVLHRDLKPDNVGEFFFLSLSLSSRSMFIESSLTQCFNNFLVRFVM